ncbi:allophanate hydrolase [Pandoraea terrae]|uniref:Allophanate hydrolase n=1 Tax=Pandoraea terrae TaxID=1537710 RepID=A0A5E4UWG3_9BURK|nr:biotin-dependent carboxyltransferase family protein [Pandoraea terrae]VVE04297.1 allophanate hydrolase [Pandoraea terrae]
MIDILRAGLLTSVQDLGRPGYRTLGVSSGGALDPLALMVANRLVGNDAGAAGLEITMAPCAFRFGMDTVMALTGADCYADLDGKPVWSWWRFPVSRGQTLTLRPARFGMRTYLAVAGGIDVTPRLGSRSTDLTARFGGHQGRPLHDGDQLQTGAPAVPWQADLPPLGVRPPVWASDPGGHRIRVLPGPDHDDFTAAAHKTFWETPWKITPNSNRMGYRLAGAVLERKKNRHHDLLSHGVLPGVIQVPPSGQPIILLADAQTTGGYPKFGVVIAADLWRLGQARLGANLHFSVCTLAQAREALREQMRYLEQIERALAWHDRGILDAVPRAAK